MEKQKNQTSYLKQLLPLFFRFSRLGFVLFIAFAALFFFKNVSAQNNQSQTNFRIGERLTYNVTFEKFGNAGYAELYVVSRGKLADRDAVELRSKIKTNNLVSAAFYLLDETRTTYASPETGLPLYVRKIENDSVSPKETISNYLIAPTVNHDLLTLVYQARNTGGTGTFSLQEGERIYSVALQNAGVEKVRTDVGEFDTIISSVVSDYLTERGIKEFRINLSTDEQKIPVQFRLKTAKGEFRATLASNQIIEGETEPQPALVPVQTPRPSPTPTPVPTPTPYIENQPLLGELPFVLGETLDYQVSAAGQTVGAVRLQVKERKQFAGQDSLLFAANLTNVAAGINSFAVNDGIRAWVNPDTLAPQQIEIKFTGALSGVNQITLFDQRSGQAMLNGVQGVEVPVGTHSILSLVYAIRSFNLKPSKDPNNPVNDTRVAVFWDKQPYIFTLRPADATIINLRNEKVSAQQISINTGNPQLDSLSLRLWLSNDEKRVPLRISVGNYQADLVTETIVKPK